MNETPAPIQMKPVFYTVHQALQNFVSHIMVMNTILPGKDYRRYSPFPPTPQNNINFYPGDPMFTRKVGDDFSRMPDAIIIGPQTKRVDLSMGKHHIIVSVAFNPGGMFRLLRIPMHELMDQPFNAADMLGREILEVNEKLKGAKNALEMKSIVEAYLLNKLRPAPVTPFERAMKDMLFRHQLITMDQAASASCLSLRQFERQSKDILGYSPKVFSRLIRFSRAYRAKINQPQLGWSTIAHSFGYYDQTHLIKEFKFFTEASPGSLDHEILSSPIQVQGDIGL